MEQIWQKLAKWLKLAKKRGLKGVFLHFQVCMYK